MTSTSVTIREVGLRDGLQMVEQILPTDTKIEWLRAQAAAGMTAFDVTSFVSKTRMPQFADAPMVLAAAQGIEGVDASVLTLNGRGVELALEAGARNIVFVLSASTAHSRGNAGRDTDAALQEFASVMERVRAEGENIRVEAGIATAFGCTLEGSIHPDRVRHLATRLVELGAHDIVLADTVGYATPTQVHRLFEVVGKDLGSTAKLGGHFHDTRGMALANVVAALDAGVRKFDASLGGLGGCPFAPGASGNVATEDLVFMLQSMGWATGIDLTALLAVREMLPGWLPGVALNGAVARAGLPRQWTPLTPHQYQ